MSKTKLSGPPFGENGLIVLIDLFLLKLYHCVTDRDRRTHGQTVSVIHIIVLSRKMVNKTILYLVGQVVREILACLLVHGNQVNLLPTVTHT